MVLKEIIIKTDFLFSEYKREELLRIIKNEFKNKSIEFIGWLNGWLVINIEGIKYRILPYSTGIKLKETNSKSIKILTYPIKQEKFKIYNEILKL